MLMYHKIQSDYVPAWVFCKWPLSDIIYVVSSHISNKLHRIEKGKQKYSLIKILDWLSIVQHIDYNSK